LTHLSANDIDDKPADIYGNGYGCTFYTIVQRLDPRIRSYSSYKHYKSLTKGDLSTITQSNFLPSSMNMYDNNSIGEMTIGQMSYQILNICLICVIQNFLLQSFILYKIL
jgi:hypothetical protein